jgi:hypothetical protein
MHDAPRRMPQHLRHRHTAATSIEFAVSLLRIDENSGLVPLVSTCPGGQVSM